MVWLCFRCYAVGLMEPPERRVELSLSRELRAPSVRRGSGDDLGALACLPGGVGGTLEPASVAMERWWLCLRTWGSRLEAVTWEPLGSKTRLGEGPALQGHKKSLLF